MISLLRLEAIVRPMRYMAEVEPAYERM